METMYKGACPLALSAQTLIKFADGGNCSAELTDLWPGLCGQRSRSLRLNANECFSESLAHC